MKHSNELKFLVEEMAILNPNLSCRDLGNIFGISKDMALKIMSPYREPKELISFDRQYFSKIDSEEKAYWLGFVTADGNVIVKNKKGNFELGLCSKDIGHLEKFKQALKYEGNIKHKIVTLGTKKHNAYRITLHDYNFCLDLISLGCVPKKSLILEFPEDGFMPRELYRHYIRGFFDGNGSISTHKSKLHLNCLSTYNFLFKMIEVIKEDIKDDLGEFNVLKHGNISQWSKTGTFAIIIANYLYNDATIYLDRKFELVKKYIL